MKMLVVVLAMSVVIVVAVVVVIDAITVANNLCYTKLHGNIIDGSTPSYYL